MQAVLYWKINGKTGHGDVIDASIAWAAMKTMNEAYGAGTHWVVLSK
jgi:hypothetical protein